MTLERAHRRRRTAFVSPAILAGKGALSSWTSLGGTSDSRCRRHYLSALPKELARTWVVRLSRAGSVLSVLTSLLRHERRV
jgi:hypothetical protein